jgi:tagatose-6-phosphate ketose/aldose isomerase
LHELDRKKLGLSEVIVGENIPDSAIREGDEVIECRGLTEPGDGETPVVYIVVAQLLAFFRCLEEGPHPDSPSGGGVINRVLGKFPLRTLS